MFRYDSPRFRYDIATFRYDSSMFRYDDVSFRYDKPRFRYDAATFRYAGGRMPAAGRVFIAHACAAGRSGGSAIQFVRLRADGRGYAAHATFQPRGSHPPVSNTERKRQFRERNPGYYARIQAKKRAASKAYVAAMLQKERAMAAMLAKSKQLLLPAPVELFVIPGVNAIPQTLTAAREPAPLSVSHARD